MTDYKKIIIGTGIFLLGYFYATITQHIIPPLLDYLTGSIHQIMWVALIITWVLALLVAPIGVIVWGLTTDNTHGNQIFGITGGFLYAFFSLAIFYFTWYMTTPMANALNYTILTALFWTGLVAIYAFNVVVIPAHSIITAKQTQKG